MISNEDVLTVGGKVAIDPACCCVDCTGTPDSVNATITGFTNPGNFAHASLNLCPTDDNLPNGSFTLSGVITAPPEGMTYTGSLGNMKNGTDCVNPGTDSTLFIQIDCNLPTTMRGSVTATFFQGVEVIYYFIAVQTGVTFSNGMQFTLTDPNSPGFGTGTMTITW